MDLPNKDLGCHRTAFEKKCRQLVADGLCCRWMTIQGKDPSTGQDMNRSDCIDNWTPVLLIENSQMQRQTGAAVESFRNEVVRAAENRLSQTVRDRHDIGVHDVFQVRDSRLPVEPVAR